MPGWEETENQWRYRIKDPAQFDRFTTKNIAPGVSIVLGIKGGKSTAQSLRFSKDKYDKAKAQAWLKAHPSVGKAGTVTGSASLTASINGALGVDGVDHVTFPCVIAAEGIYSLGDTDEDGYRDAEETRKMIPFCNGLRVMEKHPTDLHQFIGADFKDDDFPVFGVTGNAQESPTRGKNGEVRVATDLRIDKVDRAGNDRTPMINGMKDGSIKEISIQYFFTRVDESGEFAGQHYDFRETDVNPYGLGIMTDGWKAKCGPDTCSIGSSGSEEQEGDAEMADKPESPPEEGGKDTTLNMNAEIKAAIADMCSDTIAEINGGVGKMKARVGELEKLNEELEAKLKEGEGVAEELEKYKAVEAKAEAEKLEGAVKAMKERIGEELFNERYPAEVETTYDQYEADWKLLESAAPSAEAPPEDAPADPEPGQNAEEPVPFYLVGTAGVMTRVGDDEPGDPRPDRTDGKMPL